MSWHYLQGQEEESWAGSSLDGAPSALLNLMPTPGACCSPGSAMDCSNDSRYGTTCEPSMAAHGGVGSMLSAADSLAPTSAQQEKGLASTERPADFGWKWHGSFAKWDRVSCSWRTRQCSLLGDLNVYSGTWPRWGSMRNGECLERTALVPRTSGIESGLWPTPTCDSATERSKRYAQGGMPLTLAVKLWPTPRANDSEKRGNFDTTNPRNGLPAAVKRYMTPTAFSTGQLNPKWVEWLMGWPVGWTACDALETDRFQEWQRQHGGF